MNAILITSIIFVIITIILMIAVYFLAPIPKCEKFKLNADNTGEKTFDDIKPYMNTGDLLFLCGDTFQEKLVRCTLHCPFSHVAMIVKKPNGELWLWEADLGQKEKAGPRFMKLEDKLEKYKGLRTGGWMRVTPSRPITYQQVQKVINENIDKGMQDRLYGWLFSNYPESRAYNLFTDQNKVYCSELIADTWQRLAIMGGRHIPSYYTPSDFYYKKISLQPEVKLENVVNFSF